MTTQSYVLQLAEAMSLAFPGNLGIDKAAAELRRLHAENERLHQINRSHEMKLSVRGYEIQIADLEAQRDALLEALKTYGWHTEDCPQYPTHARPKNWPACTCGFDAAIKAVEENT